MQIRSAALTDIGKVRRENEDRFLRDDTLRLYAVADGIGGLPGGAVAAEHTIACLRNAVASAPPVPPPDLAGITQRINESVLQLGRRVSPKHGLGTTLTCALLRDGAMHLAHVGDSRCYLLREKRLACLTTDHTVENEVRASRAAGKIIFFDESQRNALVRCIGQQEAPEVDVSRHPLQAGDRILFCTDGIDKAVLESELATLLGIGDDPDAILRGLIALADDRGGGDNATGVLVFVDAVA